MIRIGLRFRKSQARVLRALAERAKAGELGQQAVETFQSAADAAASGEPLIVLCSEPMEAVLMASGYSKFGVVAPTVEEVSGE